MMFVLNIYFKYSLVMSALNKPFYHIIIYSALLPSVENILKLQHVL